MLSESEVRSRVRDALEVVTPPAPWLASSIQQAVAKRMQNGAVRRAPRTVRVSLRILSAAALIILVAAGVATFLIAHYSQPLPVPAGPSIPAHSTGWSYGGGVAMVTGDHCDAAAVRPACRMRRNAWTGRDRQRLRVVGDQECGHACRHQDDQRGSRKNAQTNPDRSRRPTNGAILHPFRDRLLDAAGKPRRRRRYHLESISDSRSHLTLTQHLMPPFGAALDLSRGIAGSRPHASCCG